MKKFLIIGFVAFVVIVGIVSVIQNGEETPQKRVKISGGSETPNEAGSNEVPEAVDLPVPGANVDPGEVEGIDSPPTAATVEKNHRDYRVSPEPYEEDPEMRAQIEQELSERPAFQHLPYSSSQIQADFTDIAGDGRVIVEITHRGSREQARSAWQDFLKEHNDSGNGYLVLYKQL